MNRFVLMILGLAGFADAVLGAPTGSAFSYQGRLVQAGNPANGRFDLRFTLFASPIDPTPCSASITNAGLLVSNGLFSATLDFGTNVFAASSCWLEIAVHHSDAADDFVVLAPRQLLTPAPYSIYTLKAESLVGPVPDAQLSTNIARLSGNQTFSGSVTFNGPLIIRTGVNGDGSGLSNVVARSVAAAALEKLWRAPIPFVTVTNAGNEADIFSGVGAVPYNFRVGKFEINNLQYTAFLNAVAADDPHALYSTNMAADVHGGILRSGSPGDYNYAPKAGMEHKPVVWVDFRDAIRFCNWLHNGQPSGAEDSSTTEDGAYTINDGVDLTAIVRNPGARFFLPNDDEWYKAAYHQPFLLGGTSDNYWLYPTRSNDAPFSEPPPGSENSINARYAGSTETEVGAYVSARSFYGTFDQGGNVEEWTEAIVFGLSRRLRGGSWTYNSSYARSIDFEFDTIDYDASAIGFRVAGTCER